MNFSEIVREILRERLVGPERPTPHTLAARLAPEADRYLDRVRYDLSHYVRHRRENLLRSRRLSEAGLRRSPAPFGTNIVTSDRVRARRPTEGAA